MRPLRVAGGCGDGAERAGEALVRPDLCPFVKSVLGAAATRQGDAGEVDAWAGMFTCDMTRRLFQELERITGAPVFQFQLPATRTPESARWFAESMAKAVDRIVRAGFAGGYDPEAALAWEMERINNAEILRKAALSWEVPPVDLHKVFHRFFTRGTPPPEGLPRRPPPGVRVAVTGSMLCAGDRSVPGALQKTGAGYLPLGCSGLAGLPATVPEDGAVESLAMASFHDTVCMRNRPNRESFQWILRRLEESGSRGLVLKTLSFCDLWNTEKERFRRDMPVPVLFLPGEGSPGEEERTGIRIQAFVEMLEGAGD